jgi:hypothetical protein
MNAFAAWLHCAAILRPKGRLRQCSAAHRYGRPRVTRWRRPPRRTVGLGLRWLHGLPRAGLTGPRSNAAGGAPGAARDRRRVGCGCGGATTLSLPNSGSSLAPPWLLPGSSLAPPWLLSGPSLAPLWPSQGPRPSPVPGAPPGPFQARPRPLARLWPSPGKLPLAWRPSSYCIGLPRRGAMAHCGVVRLTWRQPAVEWCTAGRRCPNVARSGLEPSPPAWQYRRAAQPGDREWSNRVLNRASFVLQRR